MTVFNSYSTGTVTVAAGGTTVTGTGTTWSGINAKPGDDLVINGFTAVVMDVVDPTHLTIKAWPYAAQTAQPYAIVWRSPLRYVGGQAMHDVDSLIAYLTGGVLPTISGGVAANSTLVLQSTSAVSGSTTDVIQFKTGSPPVERARIDSKGVVYIGGAPPVNAVSGSVASLALFAVGGGTAASGATNGNSIFSVGSYDSGSHGGNSNVYMGISNWNNDGYGEFLSVAYSRGTPAANLAVQAGDFIGGFKGIAYYNATNAAAACSSVEFFVDGTYSSGVTAPAMMQLKTCPAGGSNTERMRLDSKGNIVISIAAIATNATDGFLYVPTCAGTPTGTPSSYPGRVPIVVNTTNNKLYFYSSGAWRDAGP